MQPHCRCILYSIAYYAVETWHPDAIIVNCLKNGRHFNQNPYTTSKDVLCLYILVHHRTYSSVRKSIHPKETHQFLTNKFVSRLSSSASSNFLTNSPSIKPNKTPHISTYIFDYMCAYYPNSHMYEQQVHIFMLICLYKTPENT